MARAVAWGDGLPVLRQRRTGTPVSHPKFPIASKSPKMDLKTRELTAGDLEQVIAIGKSIFPHKSYFSKNYFQKFYQSYPQGFLVFKNGEEIIGYVIGQKEGEKGKIISLAVKKNEQKKGIGKKLVNHLINNFQKDGVNSILLHVREKNQNALAFYQKLGFKLRKTAKNFYADGDSAFLLELKI